jgi:hypothetical protein
MEGEREIVRLRKDSPWGAAAVALVLNLAPSRVGARVATRERQTDRESERWTRSRETRELGNDDVTR